MANLCYQQLTKYFRLIEEQEQNRECPSDSCENLGDMSRDSLNYAHPGQADPVPEKKEEFRAPAPPKQENHPCRPDPLPVQNQNHISEPSHVTPNTHVTPTTHVTPNAHSRVPAYHPYNRPENHRANLPNAYPNQTQIINKTNRFRPVQAPPTQYQPYSNTMSHPMPHPHPMTHHPPLSGQNHYLPSPVPVSRPVPPSPAPILPDTHVQNFNHSYQKQRSNMNQPVNGFNQVPPVNHNSRINPVSQPSIPEFKTQVPVPQLNAQVSPPLGHTSGQPGLHVTTNNITKELPLQQHITGSQPSQNIVPIAPKKPPNNIPVSKSPVNKPLSGQMVPESPGPVISKSPVPEICHRGSVSYDSGCSSGGSPYQSSQFSPSPSLPPFGGSSEFSYSPSECSSTMEVEDMNKAFAKDLKQDLNLITCSDHVFDATLDNLFNLLTG